MGDNATPHHLGAAQWITLVNVAHILRRTGISLAALAVLVAIVVLVHSSDASRGVTPIAPSSNLSTVTTTSTPGSSITTLPPSRDNDAGRSRLPDVTPDADSDVSQVAH